MNMRKMLLIHVKAAEHMENKLGQEAVKDDLLIPLPHQPGSESS